jgi:cold shock CspA family protein
VRRNGFHLVLKEVQRYKDADGQLVLKANADLDLAVDALLQAQNLDYILLGSGDGDFIRLVRALQDHGKRVDGISFAHTSTALRNQFDHYFNGALIPGILPSGSGDGEANQRLRGIMHSVFEDKGYGFLTVRTGYQPDQNRDDIFCHISDFSAGGVPIGNTSFSYLKESETIIEFDLVEQADGKVKAINACEFDPLGER